MGKFILILMLLSTPSQSFSNNHFLLIKPCYDCEWFKYVEPFRLREQCEIARQGFFFKGITKCVKTSEI